MTERTVHELIDEVPNLSAPSTTKFRDLISWFALRTGIPEHEMYATYVNDAGNASVRLTQSRNAQGKKLAIVVSGHPAGTEEHQSIASAVQRLMIRPTIASTVAICAKQPKGKWELTEVVSTQESASLVKALQDINPAVDVQTVARKLSAPAADDKAPHAGAPRDIDGLAASLFVDAEWLHQVLWLLEDRNKALILYGPPGTGKTYIARKIAEFLQPNHAWRRLVQLHPSYGYEDFFEGYRPAKANQGLALEKKEGPLRYLAGEAARNPEERIILTLDEVNRGNLPRVFGELYLLLEYRAEAVSLMYSPEEEFSLPSNLYFVGTMNSSDRSIAVLDQALRRRFHFVPMFPGEPPVDGFLRRYLTSTRPSMAWVADLLELANSKLERHARIGPSHFMRTDLDDAVLERVWSYSVLPSIEEHYFGRDEDLAQLRLEALRARLGR